MSKIHTYLWITIISFFFTFECISADVLTKVLVYWWFHLDIFGDGFQSTTSSCNTFPHLNFESACDNILVKALFTLCFYLDILLDIFKTTTRKYNKALIFFLNVFHSYLVIHKVFLWEIEMLYDKILKIKIYSENIKGAIHQIRKPCDKKGDVLINESFWWDFGCSGNWLNQEKGHQKFLYSSSIKGVVVSA